MPEPVSSVHPEKLLQSKIVLTNGLMKSTDVLRQPAKHWTVKWKGWKKTIRNVGPHKTRKIQKTQDIILQTTKYGRNWTRSMQNRTRSMQVPKRSSPRTKRSKPRTKRNGFYFASPSYCQPSIVGNMVCSCYISDPANLPFL